jgi:hypothetical protein
MKRFRLPRFRFGLRAMLAMVLAVALLLWGATVFYDRYNSTPLAEAIAWFNSPPTYDTKVNIESVNEALQSYHLRWHPPLTETEVIDAINKQVPLADAPPQVNAAFRKIARTHRIPKGAYFDDLVEMQNGQYAFRIHLNVTPDGHPEFALKIRDRENPITVSVGSAGVTNNASDDYSI